LQAEILANLARLGARIEEVQVDLDWSRREGESKMPVFKTMPVLLANARPPECRARVRGLMTRPSVAVVAAGSSG